MSFKNTFGTLFLSAGLVAGSADFAVAQHNESVKQEVITLLNFPTPITPQDSIFVEKNKYNDSIQRDKILFTETAIRIDGLKFSRNLVKYNDVKNVPGLKLRANVYQKDGYDYFTFDAVQKLGQAGYTIPNNLQRKKAADVLEGNYGTLGTLLGYPKAGGRMFYGIQNTIGSGPFYALGSTLLRSSTPHIPNINAYGVWFDESDGARNFDDQRNARSVVFLEK